VYELARDTFTGAGRSEDSPVSVVGVGRLGGDVAASSAPVVTKVASIIGLAGSLNLFLFLFNLLPILPLDGGHVAGALYEGIRRRIAKWRNRPDPGPVDVAKALPVAYAVTAVMLLASMVIIWADVVNPLRIT
jgi:membrane-associated protease RseP (regulator of RpoE activity)